MGWSPEDLSEVMNDRKKWQERVRDIRASGTTWWWWWHIHIYTYTEKQTWLIHTGQKSSNSARQQQATPRRRRLLVSSAFFTRGKSKSVSNKHRWECVPWKEQINKFNFISSIKQVVIKLQKKDYNSYKGHSESCKPQPERRVIAEHFWCSNTLPLLIKLENLIKIFLVL